MPVSAPNWGWRRRYERGGAGTAVPGFEGEEETTLGAYMTFKNGVNADKDAYGRGRKFVNVMDIIRSEPITHDSIIGSVDISDAEFAKNEVKFGDILFQEVQRRVKKLGKAMST